MQGIHYHNWQPTGNSFYGHHELFGEIPQGSKAFEFVCEECSCYTIRLMKYISR